ncbi:reticulon-like protein B17 isoform X2 [Gossypium australe]|uniref:Reticulon-like protein n=1 Tax=Gossypium australe TaxID=47621 RepID=A0A5B6WP62_9ROSI|nr:reticulon-like protein B17 isoform X2 [Gossypium australe]
MEPSSTPPSHRSNPISHTKSASRLARIGYSVVESGERERPTIPHLSLDHISPSPKKLTTPASPSPLSLRSSTNSLPLQELLLLSPASPLRRSRTRLADRLEMAEEVGAAELGGGSRRKCKSRASQTGVLGCGTPRNSRRSRRRMEMELREDRDLVLGEEMGKPRKRRHSGKSKKEKLSLVPALPSSTDDCEKCNLDRMGEMISDLVMWRDVAKSSLWFGFGCLCFLSSCFTKGVTFSIFSVISHIGLLCLGVSFFSNSIYQNVDKMNEFKLKEEDFLRLAKLTLPATNFAISKMRKLFSGEPSMTLKVAPLLLLGAEYGHIITLRRLCAFAEYMKEWGMETWGACSHKKLVAASAATAFWNLSSIKTRIFTAFITMVIIRYCRQHLVQDSVEVEAEEVERELSQKALVVVREESKKN